MVRALYFDDKNKLWLETFLESILIGFNVDLKRIYIEKSETIIIQILAKLVSLLLPNL